MLYLLSTMKIRHLVKVCLCFLWTTSIFSVDEMERKIVNRYNKYVGDRRFGREETPLRSIGKYKILSKI